MFLLFQTGRVNSYSASSEFSGRLGPSSSRTPSKPPVARLLEGSSRMGLNLPSTCPRTPQTIAELDTDILVRGPCLVGSGERCDLPGPRMSRPG